MSVSLERVLHRLCDAIDGLRRKLEEVAVHVSDDRPWDAQARADGPRTAATEAPHHYLVSELDEGVSDVLGWVSSARAAAGDARSAAESAASLDAVRRGLVQCRTSLDRVRSQFERHVGGRRTLTQLEEASAEKKGEWPGWVACLTREMELGRRSLAAAERALVDSLEELASSLCGADRAGLPRTPHATPTSEHTAASASGISEDALLNGPGAPNGTARHEHTSRSTTHGLRR